MLLLVPLLLWLAFLDSALLLPPSMASLSPALQLLELEECNERVSRSASAPASVSLKHAAAGPTAAGKDEVGVVCPWWRPLELKLEALVLVLLLLAACAADGDGC